jgi:hypothetical protein
VASEDQNQATESQQGNAEQGNGAPAQQTSDQASQNQSQQVDDRTAQEVADNTPVKKNDPRTSVQKPEKYRFAANIPADKTIAEQEYADYVLDYSDSAAGDATIPDVLLDVPVVKVDEINFELNDLRAKVSLYAKVLDLVELSVGSSW